MGFMAPVLGSVTLSFEDGHRLEGLHVKCKSTNQADIDRISELPLTKSLQEFVDDYVIEWDLEDEDGPLPPNRGALARVEPWVINAIQGGWFRGLYQIPPPLVSASRNGASQAES